MPPTFPSEWPPYHSFMHLKVRFGMKVPLFARIPGQVHDDWVLGLAQFKSDRVRFVAWFVHYFFRAIGNVAFAFAGAVSTVGLGVFAWYLKHGYL